MQLGLEHRKKGKPSPAEIRHESGPAQKNNPVQGPRGRKGAGRRQVSGSEDSQRTTSSIIERSAGRGSAAGGVLEFETVNKPETEESKRRGRENPESSQRRVKFISEQVPRIGEGGKAGEGARRNLRNKAKNK